MGRVRAADAPEERGAWHAPAMALETRDANDTTFDASRDVDVDRRRRRDARPSTRVEARCGVLSERSLSEV